MVLLGTVVLCLIIAEILIRIFQPSQIRSQFMTRPDPPLGFSLTPNYKNLLVTPDTSCMVEINKDGFRDYEYSPDKDSSVYRIMVLGDSFVFGWGVNMEDSFPKKLEKELNETHPLPEITKYEVMNTGGYGYGTLQEYLFYKQRGYLYHPDLVILAFFKNDVEESNASMWKLYRKTQFDDTFRFLSLGKMNLMLMC